MKIKIVYKVLLLLLISRSYGLFAQAPVITYVTPQNYPLNTTIVPLKPTTSGGGAVPATIYGQVTTFAGTSNADIVAGFGTTTGVVADNSNNFYVTDASHNQIWQMTPMGVATILAGSGSIGSADGPGTDASFLSPTNLATDGNGNIYVSDVGNNRIRKITSAGEVTTLAGSDLGYEDGPGTTAKFNRTTGIAVDKLGNVFVADRGNNVIRKITPLGLVSTFAGNGTAGNTNGTGALATFDSPLNLCIDAAGNLYVTSNLNNIIRKITPAGEVTTFAGNATAGNTDGPVAIATFNNPAGITADRAGNIYVADAGNFAIRKINPAGMVSTIAGGSQGFTNGVGTAASFSGINQLTIGPTGDLYVADALNNAIRKVILTGYTIDKPLPVGLSFDPKTGIITGMPMVISPLQVYNITAYNVSGSYTTTLNLSVTAASLLLPSVITFPPIAVKTPHDADFSLGVTSTNTATPIIYTSSNTAVATVSAAGVIHINGAGSTTITASQGADATHDAATDQSRILTVTASSAAITIINTFSPNGDGINDNWNIPVLVNYPNCLVSVFNRYGALVYQSKGYAKAWNGSYKGSNLASGAYYYVINLGNSSPMLSGSVTIIR